MDSFQLGRLASVLNRQAGTFASLEGSAPFAVAISYVEANTLAIYGEDGEVSDLIQSPDARTLFYAVRQVLRRRIHDRAIDVAMYAMRTIADLTSRRREVQQ